MFDKTKFYTPNQHQQKAERAAQAKELGAIVLGGSDSLPAADAALTPEKIEELRTDATADQVAEARRHAAATAALPIDERIAMARQAELSLADQVQQELYGLSGQPSQKDQ